MKTLRMKFIGFHRVSGNPIYEIEDKKYEICEGVLTELTTMLKEVLDFHKNAKSLPEYDLWFNEYLEKRTELTVLCGMGYTKDENGNLVKLLDDKNYKLI